MVEFCFESFDPEVGVGRVLGYDRCKVVDVADAEIEESLAEGGCSCAGETEADDFHWDGSGLR
jgi:hypothetical protein